MSLQNQVLLWDRKGEARPVWEDAKGKLELELTLSLFVHHLQSSAEEGQKVQRPTMVKVEVSEKVKGSKNAIDNTSTIDNASTSDNTSAIDNTSTSDNIPTSDNTSD